MAPSVSREAELCKGCGNSCAPKKGLQLTDLLQGNGLAPMTYQRTICEVPNHSDMGNLERNPISTMDQMGMGFTACKNLG